MFTFTLGLVLVLAVAWALLEPLFNAAANDPIADEVRQDDLDQRVTTYQELRDLELDYTMGKVEEKEYKRTRKLLEDLAIASLKASGDAVTADGADQRADIEALIARRRSRWTRMRNGVVGAVALLLTFGMPGRLQAQGGEGPAGQPVSGTTGSVLLLVTNGTEGASVPDSLEVTLEGVRQSGVDPELNRTAYLPASGRLLFEDLAIEPGVAYRITTIYQEAEYTSSMAVPRAEAPGDTISLTLYEATEDPKDVLIRYDHNVVTAEKGGVRIQHMIVMENGSDRVYIGPYVEEVGQRAVVRVDLPEEAAGIELQSGLMQCCVQFMGHTLIERMPVFPGKREILFSYTVPARKGRVVLPKTFFYPVAQTEIFVPADLTVSVTEPLSLGDSFEAGGTQFKRITGTDLEAGLSSAVTITGVVGRTGLGIPRLALVGLIGLSLFAGLILLSWRSKRIASEKGSAPKVDAAAGVAGRSELRAEMDQDLLIERIAWLDELFETGALEEAFYRRERALLMDLVEDL